MLLAIDSVVDDGIGSFSRLDCSFLSVDRQPPQINNCDSGIDLRVENLTASIIASKNSDESYFYNWTFPSAFDYSNPDIDIEPFMQTRPRDDKVFYPGRTNVTIAFTDPSGNVASCSFVVIVRKLFPLNVFPVFYLHEHGHRLRYRMKF